MLQNKNKGKVKGRLAFRVSKKWKVKAEEISEETVLSIQTSFQLSKLIGWHNYNNSWSGIAYTISFMFCDIYKNLSLMPASRGLITEGLCHQ